MTKLLIATTNEGKISEYKELLKDLNIKLVTLKDMDINQDVEETGKTFRENAIIKARFYQNLTGLPVLSDDAGLEIDCLNGEPGVCSRRWPGYRATDEELMNFALKKMEGVPKEKRGAQFHAAMGLCFPGQSEVFIFEGILRGSIAEKPYREIERGYPFRPIFIPENIEGEHIFEHRRIAVKKALPTIKQKLC